VVRIFILLKSSQFSTGFNMTSFGYFCLVNEALKNWVILIVLSCLWGSSFILMKLGMFDQEGDVVFTDRQVAGLRMLIASAVLMPFALSNIRKVSDLKTWVYLLIVGFCGNFIPAYLFTYAETGISSGYTGMLNSSTPIFALLIGFVFFGNRLNRLQLSGVGVGTVGIFCLSLAGRDLHLTGYVTHILAVIQPLVLCHVIKTAV
jgi:drug/metabolite transporter (DMT)-like permease